MNTCPKTCGQPVGRTSGNKRRGGVVPLAAILLAIVFGMVAFAIDMGQIVHVDTELQRTADACALAAVLAMPDQSQAVTIAQEVAVENYGTAGPDLEVSDVEFGDWDADTATFTPTMSSPNGVRVTVRRTAARGNALPLLFAPVFGETQADVVATAIAMYDNEFCGPLIGIEWVDVPGGPTTDSYLSGSGPYYAQTPRDNGSICSDGPISLDGGPVVNGDANPGRNSQTTLEGNSVVTGSTTPRLRPLNLPPVDTSEVSVTNDNATLPLILKGNSYVSPLDAKRNFLLDGNRIYTVPPGQYYLNDLILTGSSTLEFSGPTDIYLTGILDTAGGNLVNQTQVPSNLRIFMTSGTARITSKTGFYGLVYAPNTTIQLDGSADWYGAMVGRTLTATGDGNIHYDEDMDLIGLDVPKRVALVR